VYGWGWVLVRGKASLPREPSQLKSLWLLLDTMQTNGALRNVRLTAQNNATDLLNTICITLERKEIVEPVGLFNGAFSSAYVMEHRMVQ